MRVRTVPGLVLAAFALIAAPGPVFAQDGDAEDDRDDDGGDDDKKKDGKKKDGKEKGRKIDTKSPEAQALAEMLNVKPNYGKQDKRVELDYSFSEEIEIDDFSMLGFDRQEISSGVELAVGSQSEGLMVHSLTMKGDFEIEYHVRLEWMAPSSVVVYVFGSGKSGALWGPAWCKRTSRGYKPVSSKVAKLAKLAKEPYNGARDVKLRYVMSSGQVTCYVNGRKVGDTKKLKGKLNGKIGLYLKNVRLRVDRIIIKGEIDTSKL
jgi:hypothetical protein